jgi:hypothetical protein
MPGPPTARVAASGPGDATPSGLCLTGPPARWPPAWFSSASSRRMHRRIRRGIRRGRGAGYLLLIGAIPGRTWGCIEYKKWLNSRLPCVYTC